MKLLTKKETAELLRKEIKSISRYVNEGMPVFSEHPLLFNEEDVLEWIKNRKRKPRKTKEN